MIVQHGDRPPSSMSSPAQTEESSHTNGEVSPGLVTSLSSPVEAMKSDCSTSPPTATTPPASAITSPAITPPAITPPAKSSSSAITTPPPESSSSSSFSTPSRMLPSIPDAEAQLSLASRMIDRKTSTPKGNHGYSPFFLEYSLLAEYSQLQKQKLPGVYVIPSARSPLLWFGMLFIRQGLYQEGVFRFSIHIPDNFPDGDCPRLFFEPSVFHPVIDPETGELDVKRAYQKWRRNVNHIWQILLYARRIFYKIDTKAPLNPEAAVLYEQDLDLYKIKVSDVIKRCREKVHESPEIEDAHNIRFSQWEDSKHEEAKHDMLQPKASNANEGPKNAQTSGLSWMKKGSNEIFTCEDSLSSH